MAPSRAIILAAGNGTRMGHLTADRPKAMLEVDGRSLIDRQLDALASAGINDVTVVVGYRQDRLRAHLGDRVHFISNDRYKDTNSLYSLSLAREPMQQGAVIMNSDVLVSPELLGRLIESPIEDAALVDTSSTLGEEEMKVRLWHGFAIDFSKALPPWEAHAENVGVLKFGAEGGRRLIAQADRLIESGYVNAWAPQALRAVAREWPIRAITTDGLPWTEIDFPEDLDRAWQLAAPVRKAA